MAALQLRSVQGLRAPLATRASRRPVVVKAMKEEVDRVKQAAVAGLVATALLTGAMATPEEALAARSGGRASSSGFSARRAAPPRAAQ